jgi:hypothetical protein
MQATAASTVAGQFLTTTAAGGVPSWGSPPMLFAGTTSGLIVNGTGTDYAMPMGFSASSSTDVLNGTTRMIVAKTGTVRNLYVGVPTAVGTGNSRVFTLLKNGIAQSVTCTISGNVNKTANDITNSFSVSAGDEISIQIAGTKGGGNLSSSTAGWGFEIDTP